VGVSYTCECHLFFLIQAASEACGWSHYLTDCHNESFYDTPSSACKVATVSALAYLPKSWDPYDVTAPTCHAGDNDLSSSSSTGDKKKVSASAGSAFVAAYSPALEHLKVTWVHAYTVFAPPVKVLIVA